MEPGWQLAAYLAALLLAVFLGLFLHPEWRAWNLFRERRPTCSLGFLSYAAIALLHFFFMGFALVGALFALARCFDAAVDLSGLQLGLQLGAGAGVYVGHIVATYGPRAAVYAPQPADEV